MRAHIVQIYSSISRFCCDRLHIQAYQSICWPYIILDTISQWFIVSYSIDHLPTDSWVSYRMDRLISAYAVHVMPTSSLIQQCVELWNIFHFIFSNYLYFVFDFQHSMQEQRFQMCPVVSVKRQPHELHKESVHTLKIVQISLCIRCQKFLKWQQENDSKCHLIKYKRSVAQIWV